MYQRGPAVRPPIGIAFDGDLGNRIDAILAVAMLNGLTAKTEARRISLSVSRPSLVSAQIADVVAGFYRGRPAGAATGGVGAITEGMLGMPEGGPAVSSDKPVLAKTLETQNRLTGARPTRARSRGSSARRRARCSSATCCSLSTTEMPPSCSPVPTGATVWLLDLYRSGPQIAAKCKQLVVAAGSFPSGAPDATIKAYIAAAKKLFAEWTTSIVAVGLEVGDVLPYLGASIEKDFAWAPVHPVVDAYRSVKPMPYDAPASALAAMLYAVHPDDGYFKVSDPGTITVLDDGRTKFTPGAEGKHRYLIADPAMKEKVQAVYTAMVSAPPAPRPGRGRAGAV